MKTLKKWLALAMAAVLMMGLLPSLPHTHAEELPEVEPEYRVEEPAPQPEEARQEEPAAEKSEPESGTWTWVNPAIPEGLITNTQVPDVEPMGIPNAQPHAEQKRVKEEKAAEELRKMLRNRSGPIYLEVYSDIREPYEFMDHLVNLATEPTGDPHDGDYLRWSIGQIGFSYILNYWGYEIMIDATYLLTEDQEAEMDGAISSAVKNLGVSGESNYEKIRAVYDYLCDEVTYLEPSEENELLSYTAYGALMNKEATSHGFAVLANRMLLELGVDNRVVGGAVGEYEHLWNVVELDDGLFYNMDAALDAGKLVRQWFLKGVEDFPEHYRYLNYETVAFHTAYPVAVKAYNPDVPGELYPYIAAGQCGDTAYWLLWWNGLLTISGEGKMQDGYPDYENWEDEPWQFWAKEIKEVIVEEGITRIGSDAFAGHTALEKATIPSTVTYFVSAFEECTSLKEVIIKEGVTEISSYAFFGCTALESIDIPDTVTGIDNSAFEDCTSLKEIVISEAIEEIGSSAFSGCKNLTRAYICCKKVPYGAFSGCGITELILSDNVTEIGWYAFTGNPLTEVVFPDSIKVLSGFDNCDNLTKVVLPKNLEKLDYYAFAYCDNLVEVVSSEKLTTIGREAFRKCPSLTTLSFAEGLLYISAQAFYDCDGLTVVKLPDSVREIGERAFRNCNALREFHMSRDLTSIGYYNGQVFTECENLETVWFYGDAPTIHIALGGGTIIAYYPEDNPTWDSVISNSYGGTITWVPFHVCSNFEIRNSAEPTCDKDGYTGDAYCVKCGELVEKGEVIPATGHTWGEWEVTQEPTEDTPGAKRRHCAVCGAQEDRHIPATGTVFGDANGDGEINGKDLILLRQRLAGWEVELVDRNADANGDGTVNGKDLILLRQHLAGWDVVLGPTE